jgi:hypothetical protein
MSRSGSFLSSTEARGVWAPPPESPKRKLGTRALVLIIVGAVVAVGAGIWLARPWLFSHSSSTGYTPSPYSAPNPVLFVPIELLLARYKTSRADADASFAGKLVETAGIVNYVQGDAKTGITVTVGASDQYSPPGLACSIRPNHLNPRTVPARGQRIAVQGHLSGLVMNDVGMKDGQIVWTP